MSILYALIGPSGVGKTTIGRRVFGADKELVSTTTRPIRKNEKDGKDYYFTNEEDFKKRLAKHEFVEHDYYGGNYYGLSIKEIESKTADGDAFVVITEHGYDQIREVFRNILPVFIYASKEDTKLLLEKRGESTEIIEKRLELYNHDLLNKDKCAFSIKNEHGNLDYVVRFFKLVVKRIKERKLEESFNV